MSDINEQKQERSRGNQLSESMGRNKHDKPVNQKAEMSLNCVET